MTDQMYLNDSLVAAADARISVSDSGIAHGAGLFETLRTYGGSPFRLEAHLGRMRKSADALGLAMPWSDEAIASAVTQVMRANGLTDARLRITITPGVPGTGEDGAGKPTLLVAGQKVEPYPAEYYERGMTVCVSSYRQATGDPIAGHKTLSYFPRLLGLREAHRKRCGEALWMTTDHRVAEGCISNVFVVRGEKLMTPPLETPVLPGIAREVVLECAAKLRIDTRERPLTIEDLLGADEVFLTNSIMEVMPVCRIERHGVGDEKIGETTRRLHEAYRDVVCNECRMKDD